MGGAGAGAAAPGGPPERCGGRGAGRGQASQHVTLPGKSAQHKIVLTRYTTALHILRASIGAKQKMLLNAELVVQ